MNTTSLPTMHTPRAAFTLALTFAAAALTAPALGSGDDLLRPSPLVSGGSIAPDADVRSKISDLRSELSSLGGQDPDLAFAAVTEEPQWWFRVGANYEHQFRTDIDGGGRFSMHRFAAGLTTRFPITREFGLSFGFRYEFDDFNFSGVTGLAPLGVVNPWEDIHTFTFTAIGLLSLDEDWSVFGGPVFQIAGESGTNVRDSWTGGGVIGVNYRVSDDLTLGLGIGVTSKIEDSARIFPIILVRWQIIDNLWLSTRTIAETTGDSGLELVYVWGGGFETALGVVYRWRRFRLDRGGNVAPNGVGQHTYIPLWVRVGYHINPNISIHAYGGVALAGQLRLENSAGARIGRQDYDPAGFLGANVTVRF